MRWVQKIDEDCREAFEKCYAEYSRKYKGSSRGALISLMIQFALQNDVMHHMDDIGSSPKSKQEPEAKPKPKSIDDLDPDTRAKAVAEIKAKYPGMFITPAAIMRHLNGESLDDLRGNA